MSVVVSGVALFSGETTTVRLERTEGPTTLRTAVGGGPVIEWSRIDAFQTTAIAHASGARLACVEHLFAALAAMRAYEGVAVTVEGGELPILDGGAATWRTKLEELGLDPNAVAEPRLVIDRDESIDVEGSIYRFERAAGAHLEVEIDLDGAGPFVESLPRAAVWNGDAKSFEREIAHARTFVLARDLHGMAENTAIHAPPGSVVVLGETEAACGGAPFDPREPVRHKLLDLVGDAFLYGGPPLGRLVATRPGHRRNHEAMRLALARGIVRPR